MIHPRRLDPDVIAERQAFKATLKRLDPASIKVVDESRIEVGQRLGYSYSERGKRCYDVGGYRSKLVRSLVGWLALDGSGVVATQPGTVRGWTFRGFVRTHLVPHLKPGDVVIWDNAQIHKVEGVREEIESCGARVLALPRYSPDLSPIELAWSKIKSVVKRARSRTVEELEQALEAGVAAVGRSDASGWFRHCGYQPQSSR